MAPIDQPIELVNALVALVGRDFGGWLRAWARVTPVLAIVPAFGGAALPAPTRAGLAAALALTIAPALRPVANRTFPLPVDLLLEALHGLPVALGAALLVYTALMAGGVIDDLRGARDTVTLPVFDADSTPLGAVLGLLVSIALLESGAAAKLVSALAQPVLVTGSLTAIIALLTASVSTALAVAAPVVGVSIVVSAAEALLARASLPAHVGSLLAPLRALLILSVAALALDRMVALMAVLAVR